MGVLGDVEGHRIDESQGVIMVTCADGDQFEDVFHHHSDICRSHRCNTRIHPLSLNGGAKLIAKNSPLQTAGEDQVLLNNILGAHKLKGIDTVVLYAHAPCGAAYSNGVSFLEVMQLLFGGKQRVKNLDPSLKVACFCHIDFGDGKKRTYFAKRDLWLEYINSQHGLIHQNHEVTIKA